MKLLMLENLFREIKVIEDFCIKRGLEKLKAHDRDFGIYTEFSRIKFSEESVEITFNSSGYDIVDIANVSLSLNEISMPEIKWNDNINLIKKFVKEEKRAKTPGTEFVIGDIVKTTKEFENTGGIRIKGEISNLDNNYLDIITDDNFLISARIEHMEKIK